MTDAQVDMETALQHSNISTVVLYASGALSRAGHTAAAVVLGLILFLGFLSNFLVLAVFARFPALRTPSNLLLVNISTSDMLVCVFGTPLSLAASVRGQWLSGSAGCRWYAFSNALFGESSVCIMWKHAGCHGNRMLLPPGMVSLVSLSLLSLERYWVTRRSTRPGSSRYRRARLAVTASWFYSLAWTVPPLLGWSSYGPEGAGTTCSVQWGDRSGRARSYVLCLLVFCLLLPLGLMIFCYGSILVAVRALDTRVTTTGPYSAERREGRVLLLVVAMVTAYLLCWTPYAVVAMLSSFGRVQAVPPAAALIPSLLAKSSTVLNPLVYVTLNHQFSRCFWYMIGCSSEAPPPANHQSSPVSEDAAPPAACSTTQ
ncbi:teleost multiple tissue opsin 3b isoform X1 [Dunckerocampus dactyliophorus]|uniref:teleost multiple tissue opsin 3b isoform X1 n=1 Tax=Dunckerocampus dactyliophorus TaxID=161453 RepID=UPI002404FE7B|nr:teleost multiple tissue opsin 3b isoform X1 [Dunckerocampus dactyliophorus]XP_054611986.1 teleost multiple tissue opsin 3b isoform X1 [Dunckerocampus dactyliophorus]